MFTTTFTILPLITLRSVNGEDVRLMLWDTAGQEEFDAITKAYYRGIISFVFRAVKLEFSIIFRVEKL